MKLRQRNWARMQPDSYKAIILREEVGLRIADRLQDLMELPKRITLLGQRPLTLKSFLEEMKIDCKYISDEEWDPDSEAFPLHDQELIVSILHLHWINNLEGITCSEILFLDFCQSIHESLNLEGCFSGVFFGGETLFELRSSIIKAQLDIEGGVSPRLSPMMTMADAGNLLSKSGFADVTVDSENITIQYPNVQSLLHDLQLMGESNAIFERKPFFRRDTMSRMIEYYSNDFGQDGVIPATFQLIWINSWKTPKNK